MESSGLEIAKVSSAQVNANSPASKDNPSHMSKARRATRRLCLLPPFLSHILPISSAKGDQRLDSETPTTIPQLPPSIHPPPSSSSSNNHPRNSVQLREGAHS